MNLATAALRIHEATVEFLATKHGTTPAAVVVGLRVGNEKLTAQYTQLVTLAIDKAAEMVKAGEIEVTA
jgi:ribosomal protein L18